MAYGYFKDLRRRKASDKVLRDKTFNIAENPKYDGYQMILLLWFINSLIKSPLHWQINLLKMVVFMIKLNQMSNKLKNCTNQLSKDLKRRVYSLFEDNICGPDLVDMHLISKFNKRTSFLLCVIDTFRKYA